MLSILSRIHSICGSVFFLVAFFFAGDYNLLHAQVPPSHTNQVPPRPTQYVIALSPVNGGKTYHVFRNTKLIAIINDGTMVSGKVRAISKDSISIDYKQYAIHDINNFKFNPGNGWGVAAAIGAVVGLAAIAFTAGGKNGERTDTQDVIFYSGIAITVASIALLIPNYFIKKNFPKTQFEYIPVAAGS